MFILLLVLNLAFVGVNLIGALGPEIFYDALWYHLTLPKIYLSLGKIAFIPGDLYYYSAMPQLGELFFTVVMFFTNEIGAKLVHFGFGVATILVIYWSSKKFLDKKFAILASLVFYSSLGVAWLSTTANIDLIRTFFESLAFFSFLFWWKERKIKNLIKTGIFVGLAIGTKYLAIGSIGIFGLLILIFTKDKAKSVLLFLIPAILVSLPWFVYAYIFTGNPVYPLFTHVLQNNPAFAIDIKNNIFIDFFKLSNGAADGVSPISPVYLAFLPLMIIFLRKSKVNLITGLYCLLAVLVWYFTPRTGGSRFIIPYLPAFSFLTAAVLSGYKKNWPILVIIFICVFNLAIRLKINSKIIPVIIDRESRNEYLLKNLDFSNTFYDTDGYFAKNIKSTDKVLFIGGQNLFYVNFPYIHYSYYRGEPVNYILTQYVNLPSKYGNLPPIYENEKTEVKFYKL